MSIYSLLSLLTALLFVGLGIVVWLRSRENPRIILPFYILCAIQFWWHLQCFFILTISNTLISSYLTRMGFSALLFLPPTFFFFFSNFLRIPGNRNWVVFHYSLSFIFFLFLWSSNSIISGWNTYPWGVYPAAGIFHPFYIAFWFAVLGHCLYTLLSTGKAIHWKGLRGKQIKYYLTLIGATILAAIDFLPQYNINIYPFGVLFTLISTIIIAYVLTNYKLIRLRIIFFRTALFIALYTLVVGFPLFFGYYHNHWKQATWLMFLLAVLSPQIYNKTRRWAERLLQKDTDRYQKSLRDLGKIMTQIKSIDEILRVTVAAISRAFSPEFIGIYSLNRHKGVYTLRYVFAQKTILFPREMSPLLGIIQDLYEHKKPVLRGEDDASFSLAARSVVFPCFVNQSLNAFAFIGPPQPAKRNYSEEDLELLEVLSTQLSLAVENCMHYEEKIDLARQEQIFRQNAMDNFSTTLANEVDNPIYAIMGMAEIIKRIIVDDLKEKIPTDKRNYIRDRMNRLIADVMRVSNMIKAIREFSSRTTGEFEILQFDAVVNNFLTILEPQFRHEGIYFEKEIEPHIKVEGNKIHLEEVILNLSFNSIQAVKYNRHKEKRIRLKIYRNTPSTILIECEDNGYGINKDIREDVFLDFTSPKTMAPEVSTGLSRIKHIIESHHGKVWCYSEGEGYGSIFFAELPLHSESFITKTEEPLTIDWETMQPKGVSYNIENS